MFDVQVGDLFWPGGSGIFGFIPYGKDFLQGETDWSFSGDSN